MLSLNSIESYWKDILIDFASNLHCALNSALDIAQLKSRKSNTKIHRVSFSDFNDLPSCDDVQSLQWPRSCSAPSLHASALHGVAVEFNACSCLCANVLACTLAVGSFDQQ